MTDVTLSQAPRRHAYVGPLYFEVTTFGTQMVGSNDDDDSSQRSPTKTCLIDRSIESLYRRDHHTSLCDCRGSHHDGSHEKWQYLILRVAPRSSRLWRRSTWPRAFGTTPRQTEHAVSSHLKVHHRRTCLTRSMPGSPPKLALENQGLSIIIYCHLGSAEFRERLNFLCSFTNLGCDPFNIYDFRFICQSTQTRSHHEEESFIGGQILSVTLRPATRLAGQRNGRGGTS